MKPKKALTALHATGEVTLMSEQNKEDRPVGLDVYDILIALKPFST